MIEETEIFEDWQFDLIEPETRWIPQMVLGVGLFFLGTALGMYWVL